MAQPKTTKKRCLGTLYHSQARLDAYKQPVCAGYRSPVEKPMDGLHKETIPSGNFKYVCLGHSIYETDRDFQRNASGNIELPQCEGLEVISAAEVLKTPAVLNEGAAGVSLSSRDQSSRGAEPTYPAQQQPGRAFVPGGGGSGDLSAGKFADSFVRSSKKILARMSTNLGSVARSAKDTLDRLRGGGDGL